MLVQAPTLGVFLQPAAQARPLSQQRFVGDLDGFLVGGQQPAVGQSRERRHRVLVSIDVELFECYAAPDEDLQLLAGVGEPDEDRARTSALGLTQGLVHRLGHARHRSADAPGSRVRRVAQRPSFAPLPQLPQRGGQQRQPTGLIGDLGDQGVDKSGLYMQTRPTSGQLDRAAQLVAAHRPHQGLIGADEPASAGWFAQRP